MRFFLFCTMIYFFVGCKKDKFTTAPQIRYVSVDPFEWQEGLTSLEKPFAPRLNLKITDAEGDLGLEGRDTGWVFARRVDALEWDSLRLPSLGSSAGKSFEAEVEVNLYELMATGVCPVTRPGVDT